MLFAAVLGTKLYIVSPADLHPVLLAFKAPDTEVAPSVTQAVLIAFLESINHITLHTVLHAFKLFEYHFSPRRTFTPMHILERVLITLYRRCPQRAARVRREGR